MDVAENLSLVVQLLIDRTKALVAIQELHVPALGWGVPLRCGHCCYEHPCPSRRLADDALGGDNNG